MKLNQYLPRAHYVGEHKLRHTFHTAEHSQRETQFTMLNIPRGTLHTAKLLSVTQSEEISPTCTPSHLESSNFSAETYIYSKEITENLLEEREFSKKDACAKQFYEWCQGEDWEIVVDLNTVALVECAEKQLPLFSKSIETLSVPILFAGSLQDQMCRKDMLEEYREMNHLIANGKIHIFDTGGHPAVATNAEQFAEIAFKFIYG